MQDQCKTDLLNKKENSLKLTLESLQLPPNPLYSVLHRVWALGCWVFVLMYALHGLVMSGPIKLYNNHEVWNLMWWHWLVLALIILLFAFFKAYRVFQCLWSPMLVKRAYHFSSTAVPIFNWTKAISVNRGIDLLPAPLLASGHICGSRRRIIVSWFTTIFVAFLIVLVGYIPEDMPWRSFIHIGVAVGLGWGLVFTLIWWFKVGLLNEWPDWVRNEYPSYLTVNLPENILIRASQIPTSNGKPVDALHEVKSVPCNSKNKTDIEVNEASKE